MANYEITIDYNKCDKCNLCIDVCEEEVLGLDTNGNVIAEEMEYCTACGDCVENCPQHAIIIKDSIDIAGKRCAYKKK